MLRKELTLYMFFLLTVSILKRPRTPPNALGLVDYQNSESDQLMKRLRFPSQPLDEVTLQKSLSLSHCAYIYIYV